MQQVSGDSLKHKKVTVCSSEFQMTVSFGEEEKQQTGYSSRQGKEGNPG